ncbi:Carboxylic ester hydrolase [Pleurotus pulmonarius]
MRLSIPYFVFGVSSIALASVVPTGNDRVVDLGYVQYLGKQTYPNTNAFLGIPYAEPPVGNRRFRAPAPLDTLRVSMEARGNIVDATNNLPPCIQHGSNGGNNRAGDEDCLRVNIWAPVGAKAGDNLPVLFYIHGGGYINGAPAYWPFDEWVDRNPDVVIVSVSYRLMIFGFLATPSFHIPHYGDLNAGFKDQIEALNWVKKYISNFGGDPNQITINGQSAGGNSVMLHLVSRQPSKHFNRAIAQSTWRAPMAFPQQMEPLFDYIVDHVACRKSTMLATMDCLRSVDAGRLVAAYGSAATNNTGPYPINTQLAPVLDGQLFTEYPTESFLAGRFSQVPLIVGATTNDSVGPYTGHSALRGNYPLVTDQDIEDIFALYPAEDFESEEHRIRRVVGDSQFICSRVLMGSVSSTRPKAWTYRYDQTEPNSPYNSGPNYVGHSSENYIFFRSATTHPRPVKFTPVETSFSEELVSYWLSFVRTGDPNMQKLARSPRWPAYTTARRERAVFQQDPKNGTLRTGIFVEAEPQKEREVCEYIYTNKYVNQQC